MSNEIKYIKPKYAKNSNTELELNIIQQFNDIKYMFRKEIDTSILTRQQLEDLHELMTSLYFLVFDCCNLRGD